MITPFSGLSFIVHIVIIVFASVSEFLFGKKHSGVKKTHAQASWTMLASQHVLSVITLLVVSTFMSILFFTALRTGLREGMNEPHIVYIREELANVGAQNVEAESESITISN